jgi:hypothetical protein
MTTPIDDNIQLSNKATENIIHLINSIIPIYRSIHAMVHRCKTTEDFFKRLEGLLNVFWGDKTPDGYKLTDAIWLHVAIETVPPECLLPLFENSMAILEGKEEYYGKETETEESH